MNYKEGMLLVDKPSGPTSHDIVDYIRRKYRVKKVGHAGTLDPMACGLLIILLGSFTKKSIHFSNYDKEYEARLLLGVSTDTADKEGKIVETKDLKGYEKGIKEIENTLAVFRGRIRQVPPMYSAKKIKGKKLYELARKGIAAKREPKEIRIDELKLLGVSLPEVSFYVKCSKGTYIRQLAHDIGEQIGCGGHLIYLKRTKIGPYSNENAVPFNKL